MKKPRPSVVGTGERLDGVLGVRHQADDVAAALVMPAMSRSEPFGLPPR